MGASLAPIGEADLALYLGRPRDAVAILEPAIEASENPFESAAMLVALGEARLALGDVEAARGGGEPGRRTRASTRAFSISPPALMLAAGQEDAAEKIAVELDNRLQSQTTCPRRPDPR